MRTAVLYSCAIAILADLSLSQCQAQTINTPADAFNAGRSFAQTGSSAAAGTVNATSGNNNLPNYSTAAPESAHYGDGVGNVGQAGMSKLAACQQRGVAGNAFAQQECDAVNFLSKNPTTRQKFIIDKDHDPLLTGSKDTIKNPSGDTGSEEQQCRVVHEVIPGTSTTEVCEQTMGTENVTCNRTLVPQCAYTGSDITNPVTTKNGVFTLPTLTPAGTRGVYNYKLEVPFKTCGSDGNAEVGFNLDSVGQGGYITVNMGNLDDAAAVAVNDYTVFAGYPNNGPMYSGSFFPQTNPAFQLGYAWVEKYGDKCTATNNKGQCTASTPLTQTFTANAKLLDFCPSGFAITPQSKFSTCNSRGCTVPPSYTPTSIPGFFCNGEGKFMMNRHEGNGSWNGSVNAQMPLKVGANRIQVYWGTGTRGDQCGNVTVTGQIFNVAPTCNAPWVDGCAALRAAQ
jgi:hypothetical protein